MPPYSPQAPADVERIFEQEGYGRNDYIVPSRALAPVATGLTEADFLTATGKFFDAGALDPIIDAELIDDVAAT